MLRAARRRVRRLVPEYSPGWRSKLVLEGGGLDPIAQRVLDCGAAAGQDLRKVRLPARELREIVAATNFKQRVRTMLGTTTPID